jgi:hypothetical protein
MNEHCKKMYELEVKYNNIKKDYKYIENIYGPPDDFCGSYCGSSKPSRFMDLLEEPTYKKAIELYKELLCAYRDKGTEDGLTAKEFRDIIKNDGKLFTIYHYWKIEIYYNKLCEEE